jgi:hypothetical protein
VILADIWSALGGFSALVAAGAALATIFYARVTVGEARQGRQESRVAHEEEMQERRTAAEAYAAAQREEMSERERSRESDLRLQRVLQVERISQLLLDLVNTAQHEWANPPPQYAPPMPLTLTGIPAILVRLGVALEVLVSLGGPEVAKARQLVAEGYGGGMAPSKVVGGGIDALREIDSLVRNDEQLMPRES